MKHTIPAPVTPRDTLERFRFYQKERGLQSITRDIDFSNVTCAQVFASIVGHIPGYLTGVPDPDNFNPRWQTLQVLSALEFQDRIREIIPAAFPEKRRLIFIHNPKCAGTDMRVTLRRNYPLIEEYLAMPAMTAKPAFFEELRIIMTTMHSSDSIAMTGHVPIWWYLANNLIRPQDEIFTSVRNPIDRVYSHLNYVLTVVISSNGKRHDAADWLRQIGMTGIAPDPSPAYILELARRFLRARGVVPLNSMCEHLGRNTAASAIETIIQTNIEITDGARYSAWRTAKFGFEPRERINVSKPMFTPDMADESDRRYIAENLIDQDSILYNRIEQAMSRTDAASIRGRMLEGRQAVLF